MRAVGIVIVVSVVLLVLGVGGMILMRTVKPDPGVLRTALSWSEAVAIVGAVLLAGAGSFALARAHAEQGGAGFDYEERG